MIVKLLTEYHLKFLNLKGGCRGSSESTLVKLLEISCRDTSMFVLFFEWPFYTGFTVLVYITDEKE